MPAQAVCYVVPPYLRAFSLSPLEILHDLHFYAVIQENLGHGGDGPSGHCSVIGHPHGPLNEFPRVEPCWFQCCLNRQNV